MFTKTLALTHRGLRRDTRMIWAHLLRLGVLSIVGLMIFGAHLSSISVGAPGLGFFSSITYTTLIFATLAGSTFFATAITEEKEEQTLGLLTLANIRPLALIVGKFLPRLLNALLILTVVFPFALLAITLGGVLWNQVWAAYWSLFAHVVFMGCIGLFFSVLCRTSGAAITWSILAMVLYFVGLPVVANLLSQMAAAGSFGQSPGVARFIEGFEQFASASAFLRLNEILNTGFDESAFGIQVTLNLAASAVLIFLSWALFGPFNRAAEGSAQALPMFDRALRFKRGSRRPWRLAIVWKDFHYLAGGWELLFARCVVYPLLAGLAAYIMVAGPGTGGGFAGSFGAALVQIMFRIVLPIEMTLIAARLFRSEIKERTWPTLVGLPTTIWRLAIAKVAGGALGLLPALIWGIIGLLLIPRDAYASLTSPEFFGSMMGLITMVPYLVMFLHLTALFSILFNAWAGVLLAWVTLTIAACFAGPLFLLPLLIVSAVTGTVSEWMGIAFGIVLYSLAFLGICFGLEVLIVQQLRSAAAR